MRLSEAIRLGAMLGPQATGGLFRGDGMCAMGAAIFAVGARERCERITEAAPYMEKEPAQSELMRELWPELRDVKVEMPHRRGEYELLGNNGAIVRLNDEEGWTREQIADWVEQIENAQSIATVDALEIHQVTRA